MSLVFSGAQQTTTTTATQLLQSAAGAWTTMCWVKISPSGATATMSIISEENNAARQTIDIRYVNGKIVAEKTSSYINVIFTAYRSVDCTSTTTLTANLYYHVAVTWSGTVMILYINGVQEATVTTADTQITAISNTLGARRTANATWDQFLQGEILDYRKYAVVLPAGEISTIATCSGLDFITQDISYRYLMFGVDTVAATQLDDWSASNYDRPITTTIPWG